MGQPHGAHNHDRLAGCNFTLVRSADTALPAKAVMAAQLLVGAVHEEGPKEVAAVLDNLDRQGLLELAVTLAAMVPVDYTPAELLAWNDDRFRLRGVPVLVVNGRPLQPHGTHAAFTRHRKNGEEPCPTCWHGEREYQREKKRGYRRQEVDD